MMAMTTSSSIRVKARRLAGWLVTGDPSARDGFAAHHKHELIDVAVEVVHDDLGGDRAGPQHLQRAAIRERLSRSDLAKVRLLRTEAAASPSAFHEADD